jgi:aspartyl-tRNA(Asn)/glutamyl-tRNA(Gln) amidotransferase subunit A
MTTDLTAASAVELTGLYRTGAASPVEAMTAVLARAEAVEPRLNSLCHIDADGALAAARASEARWKAREPLSALDGVPVSVKELLRVNGWPQPMGSKLADKTPQTEDAPSVQSLREGGALVFAQTTSPEYGFKGVTDSPLHGVTRNPWNTERTPGGSSGGSGAAVAAGLGPMALGTDGGGSVRIPAAFCGLVGHKATFGLVPAHPPSMHGDLGNTGPMTRTTRDAALMMSLISRFDPRDPFAAPPNAVDYLSGLDRGVKGLKIGLIMKYGDYWIDPSVEARVGEAARTFEQLGAAVEPIAPPPESAEAGRVWVVHWFSALQRLLQVYPEDRHGEFDPGLLFQAKIGEQYRIQQLVDAMVERRTLSSAWNRLLARYDLVISPTLNVGAFPVGQMSPLLADGSNNPAWTNTALFNLTRHPTISTPCGLTDEGLPVGLQITAAHFRDDLVLAASQALEQARGAVFPNLPA